MISEYGKGVVVGSSKLKPNVLKNILTGKISSYVNYIYLANELCDNCNAIKKGCLKVVKDGKEGICIGKCVLRIKLVMKARNGIIREIEWDNNGK
ncbi:hypothetical protein IPA_00465 [Ignicoccus pacificus DSM 13166]|uniref:Uncharacterized protein n=1 Tax=Ignicoccus pacificus DSM 13166 TaxID=940294 RepID=A0A977KAC3_9CREN|nr:hypothetical protein IPA_00465 [Ignicoccus pacificus DSM 13166]